MSDYTHDDAMRDLAEARQPHLVCEDFWYSCPKSGDCANDAAGDACRCGAEHQNEALDRLAAYIKRLETSLAYNIEELTKADAALVRLQEEHRKDMEAVLHQAESMKEIRADRNEWEAVARWLAEHKDVWSGGVEYAIDRAKEAVRHE